MTLPPEDEHTAMARKRVLALVKAGKLPAFVTEAVVHELALTDRLWTAVVKEQLREARADGLRAALGAVN